MLTSFVLLLLLPPTVALSLPAGQDKAADLPAKADEVRLKNGDRLTGEIVRMEKELLIFRTPYIDEKLSISWKEVACIVSERSLPAQFKDNEFLIGRLSCPEDGKIQIVSELLGKSNPTQLDQLLYAYW